MNISILNALKNPEEKKSLINPPFLKFEGHRRNFPYLIPIDISWT